MKFLSDRQKTFFLSLGLSALAGYETSNRGYKLLPNGTTLLNKGCFIYGGALTLELETYLTDRVVLPSMRGNGCCSTRTSASSTRR